MKNLNEPNTKSLHYKDVLYPVRCFSSIPGLYPPDARTTPTPVVTTRIISRCHQIENHCGLCKQLALEVCKVVTLYPGYFASLCLPRKSSYFAALGNRRSQNRLFLPSLPVLHSVILISQGGHGNLRVT